MLHNSLAAIAGAFPGLAWEGSETPGAQLELVCAGYRACHPQIIKYMGYELSQESENAYRGCIIFARAQKGSLGKLTE